MQMCHCMAAAVLFKVLYDKIKNAFLFFVFVFFCIICVKSIKKLLSVQLLSPVQLFVTSWTAAFQASLSITNSWSLLRLTSIE